MISLKLGWGGGGGEEISKIPPLANVEDFRVQNAQPDTAKMTELEIGLFIMSMPQKMVPESLRAPLNVGYMVYFV